MSGHCKSRIVFSISTSLALACVALSGHGPSEAQILQNSGQATIAKQNAKIEELKQKVSDIFSDPAAAQFRKLKLLSEDRGLCGEVNAKNKMGGYVGFKAFAADSTGTVIVLQKMTLDSVTQSKKEVQETAVAMMIAGSRSDAEAFVVDSILRDKFSHWADCKD